MIAQHNLFTEISLHDVIAQCVKIEGGAVSTNRWMMKEKADVSSP
jgi:hypothetical protein